MKRRRKAKRHEASNWLLAHASYKGNDCLPWPFMIDRRVGRGKVQFRGRVEWVPRAMCTLIRGDPPTKKHQARHSCGNGHNGCATPKHLSWGTNSVNQKDRRRHGTHISNPWGQTGRVTKSQGARMKKLRGKKTQMEIAGMFGVSLGCVQYWQIVRDQRMGL